MSSFQGYKFSNYHVVILQNHMTDFQSRVYIHCIRKTVKNKIQCDPEVMSEKTTELGSCLKEALPGHLHRVIEVGKSTIKWLIFEEMATTVTHHEEVFASFKHRCFY